jgi:acetyl-CoA acetyltransferase
MTETYIYDYVRTPFGRFGKGLAATRPDDLGGLPVDPVELADGQHQPSERKPAADV